MWHNQRGKPLDNGNMRLRKTKSRAARQAASAFRDAQSCMNKGKPARQERRVYLDWNESNILELSNIWGEFRHNKQMCDGIVKTGDGCAIPVHRAILSAVSPFFKALFVNTLHHGQPEMHEVTVTNLTATMLEHILDFAYTGSCRITALNVQLLLPVADQFEVLGVVKLCTAFMISQLRTDNCIGVLKFARRYFCRELESTALRHLLYHFKDVVANSREFYESSASEIDEILRHDELNVRSEDLVFEAIRKWIEVDVETRRHHLPTLLQCVRFGLTSYRFFTHTVYAWKEIANSHACQSALSDASIFLAQMESQQTQETDLCEPMARPRIPHDVLFAIGGWSTGAPTSFVETYDTRADRWYFSVSTDCKPRAYHGVATLGTMIYVIGGFDGIDHFNSVRCLDPINHTWHERACMYHARCYVSVCVNDGLLYAMGGYNGRARMSSAERYHPETNQWELIPSMHIHRSDASSTAYNGKIYIAGGFNGQEVLSSVEVFDPQTMQWSYIHPMTSPRSGVSLVSFQDSLYALGGFNGITRLNTVEKLSFQRYGPWTPVADMFSPRSNFATVVLDDMIFVIGGFNGTTTIPFVECYDSDSNEWSDAHPMNLNRSALSACVVCGLPNNREYSFLSKLQDPRLTRKHDTTTQPTDGSAAANNQAPDGSAASS